MLKLALVVNLDNRADSYHEKRLHSESYLNYKEAPIIIGIIVHSIASSVYTSAALCVRCAHLRSFLSLSSPAVFGDFEFIIAVSLSETSMSIRSRMAIGLRCSTRPLSSGSLALAFICNLSTIVQFPSYVFILYVPSRYCFDFWGVDREKKGLLFWHQSCLT